jgi:DNA-binding MarR family transcriptional regulator
MMDVVTTAPPPAPDRPTRGGRNRGRGPSAELVATAERLRLASTRLARILRRETHTGLTPTQVAALATLQRRGAVPVGVLAEAERIRAPTATKVVESGRAAGGTSGPPRRPLVSLVVVTQAGHDLLATTRQHKTAWLSMRIAALDPADRARLLDAIEVLEHLVAPHAPGAAGDQSPPPDREARP